MRTIVATTAVSLLALSAPAFAAETRHPLGEHPAVIVKRMEAKQGYDYASKFYRHPAGYYLYLEAPAETQDPADFAHNATDPAVVNASTQTATPGQVAVRKNRKSGG
jgi:hypothetical protein